LRNLAGKERRRGHDEGGSDVMDEDGNDEGAGEWNVEEGESEIEDDM